MADYPNPSNPEPLGEILEPIEGQTDALEMLQEGE